MVEIPPVPDETRLREAALAHLARFSTTRQGLRVVLQRRVKRWGVRAVRAGLSREAFEAHEQDCLSLIDQIVASMEGLGAVDDAGFSKSRARSLTRSGRSRRAVKAHLLAKGVDVETVQQAVDESLGEVADETGQETELVAALVFARKRGVGPFQRPGQPEKDRYKVLAIFARNGFSQHIAHKVLSMDYETADEMILACRAL
ncbi:regulatory protein RecX [Saccharibacter sp. 17.LH.SD]|uniref:RecX family transcriptional regulator n=1 Tax=Saccharibacter sp. 17.LH.SD TaxID=2689393 RepID=UPI00136C8689|nr:RecX family transcriptional regulator [Saccharibacter sp. 17.LH.SD]MXV45271.1 regulatory protein RecX [Saccharibacter sp. 17.LH.SD]